LASRKDEYTLFSNFGLEKKVDKNPVLSLKNVDKKLANSLIDR
jgi:hypothetical protein